MQSSGIALGLDDFVTIALSDREFLEAIQRDEFVKGTKELKRKVVEHWADNSFQSFTRRMSDAERAEFQAKLLEAADDLLAEKEFSVAEPAR
ncbi:MAG: hypothetical protein KF784_09865 [Fimbriimonadaceae bacterium]|nr:hypothetical protein [Fimbriimonadaceae bacterium]